MVHHLLKLSDQQEVIVTIELLDNDNPVDWTELLKIDYNTKIIQGISESTYEQLTSGGYTISFDDPNISNDINIHVTISGVDAV